MIAVNKRPVQVYLRPDQLVLLRAKAKQRGVSMAELIREGVDHVLNEVALEDDPLWDIIGIVDNAPPDLAENLDEYLVQRIGEESQGWGEKSS